APGQLVPGQLGAQRIDDAALIERAIRILHHGGNDRFAVIRVRHADDGRFDDARERVERQLDFLGIDVVAAAEDQILGTSDDGEVAVRIQLTDVAGAEPAVGGEFLARLFGHAPVTGEHVRSLDLHHAGRADGQRRIRVVGDAKLHAGQRYAYGTAAAFAGIRIGGDHARFGHAVAFQEDVTGPRAPRF